MVRLSSASSLIVYALPLFVQETFAACNVRARYNLNVASGWTAEGVLGGLSTPRGITIDPAGHLLVIERGKGLTGHVLGADGCVTSSRTIVQDGQLNHGIEVSVDGKTLFASTADVLYSWTYDATAMTVSNRKTLITGMNNANPDHVTRTVIQSRADPNFIVVGRGATNNLDMAAYQTSTGRAILKSFDLRTLNSAVNYSSGGKVMAYGLRNDVGFVEDKSGALISVENSADNIRRSGSDVHNNNPGEPVYIVGSAANPTGFWGGYPYCFYVWDAPSFRSSNLQVGDLFVQEPNNTVNDAWCNSKVTKPVLLLPPHTAPLDIKLGPEGDTNAYVSLHGSWNRQPPAGYKVVVIPGNINATGAWTPKSPITASQTATTDLLWNNDASRCTTGCFRPVGLVFDATGKNLYVSSDQTGEVFLVKKTS